MRHVIYWSREALGIDNTPTPFNAEDASATATRLRDMCARSGASFHDWNTQCETSAALLDLLERLNFDWLEDGVALILGDVRRYDFQITPCGLKTRHVMTARAGLATAVILRFPNVWPMFLFRSASENGDKNGILQELSTIEAFRPNESDEREFGRPRTEEGALAVALLPLIVGGHFLTDLDIRISETDATAPRALATFVGGANPLFDPTGLRTLVKTRALNQIFADDPKVGVRGPTRNALQELLERARNPAVVVDEEEDFVDLNAYSAYRHGRRVWTVSNHAFFTQGLWREDTSWADAKVHGSGYVLRDYDVRFWDSPMEGAPDGGVAPPERLGTIGNWAHHGTDISAWLDRATWRVCSSLENAVSISDYLRHQPVRSARGPRNWRLGIVGEKKAKSVEDVQGIIANQHVGSSRSRRWRMKNANLLIGTSKPITSTLFFSAHLEDSFRNWGRSDEISPRFRVSPEQRTIARRTLIARLDLRKIASGGGSHHSSPPFNLQIALSLMGKVRRLKTHAHPRARVMRAVMCSEAYEILLGKSISTALDALLGLHLSETQMETGVVGMSSRIDIGPRIDDVHETLAQMFGDGGWERRRNSNDYAVKIWSTVRTALREADLFGPANDANIEVLANQTWLNFQENNWWLVRSLRAGARRVRSVALPAIPRPKSQQAPVQRRDPIETIKRNIARVITLPAEWLVAYGRFFALFTIGGILLKFGDFLSMPDAPQRNDWQRLFFRIAETPVGVLRASLSGQSDPTTMAPSFVAEGNLLMATLYWFYEILFLGMNTLLMAFFIAMVVRQVTRD